ncbi:MAG: hypothetical protein HYT80_11315, partial [Euryarchaeota archaeon]|nr:hypothetical protein [Euryarchaeota archaeon]
TGGTFVVTARISNGGLPPTPTGTSLTVEFFLDSSGTPFHSFVYAPFLAPGASFTTSNPALSIAQGTHTVRVEVEASSSFLEAGYTNNVGSESFVIAPGTADPGSAFEDGNDDGLYNPYVASDTLLAASAVTDGKHTATGKGLVIPASVGTITSSSQNIEFVATRKLHIGTWLETTNAKQIILTAGTDLNLTGSVRVRSDHDLTVTGGTSVDISGDTLDTDNDDILVAATTGPLRATGTLFYLAGFGSEPDKITLTSGGLVDLYAAVLVGDNDFSITSNGPLNLKSANLDSGDDIELSVTFLTNNIYVQGVTINDDNDCADVAQSVVPVGTEASGRVEEPGSPC